MKRSSHPPAFNHLDTGSRPSSPTSDGERRLVPEILDTLPADSVEAQRSRRDLRLINAAMRNRAWFRRALAGRLRPDDRILELGPGDNPLHGAAPVAGLGWDGIDRAPRPAGWPRASRWHQEDILTFRGWRDYTVIVANLVMHHFSDTELAAIGASFLSSARLVVLCEPARRRRVQPLLALFCRLIRASPVTRHDGRVSIEAGFLGDELATSLGLETATWRCDSSVAGFGAYRLIAERRS